MEENHKGNDNITLTLYDMQSLLTEIKRFSKGEMQQAVSLETFSPAARELALGLIICANL